MASPTPAAMAEPMAVPSTSSTTACPSASRSRYRVEAPRAFSTATSPLRWMVHTVKKAPMTSAEIANRNPRMSCSEPFSEV